MNKNVLLLLVLFLYGCSQYPDQINSKVYFIQVTASTLPWLEKAITCAEAGKIYLSKTDNSDQADIIIRLGEPANSTFHAFAIDQEDILVLANAESQVQDLKSADVLKLFTQPSDQSIEVWSFSAEEDIQQIFVTKALQDQSVFSTARVAVTPQQMGEVLNQNKNTIGILTRHWKAGNLRELFTIREIPVLALTKSEPTAAIKNIISCLQK